MGCWTKTSNPHELLARTSLGSLHVGLSTEHPQHGNLLYLSKQGRGQEGASARQSAVSTQVTVT